MVRVTIGGEVSALEAHGGVRDSTAATGCHSASVEDGSGIPGIEDLVQAFNDGFEQAVNAIGAGDLKERAKDLRAAEGRVEGGESGGVEEVEERLEGEMGVWEVEGSRAVGGR